LSIMRLVPRPGRTDPSSDVLLAGQNLLQLPKKRMHEIRGNDIAMIFQEPMTSLNPVYRVGDQLAEGVRRHRGLSRRAAARHTLEMLGLAKIPAPTEVADSYPHELSGGMRQRAMIAMALSCDPRVLIADEPTTALDTTIQAQILELLSELRYHHDMSILLITHDFGVIAELA
ncbi:MAG: ATP-binding cassette domain-containing protein, partial [Gemmatimonas sp.]|nr:ATP-binding cassette domain-containing protein [Gemmatimonas sp.]